MVEGRRGEGIDPGGLAREVRGEVLGASGRVVRLRHGGIRAGLARALDFVLSQESPQKKGYLVNLKASPHGPMYNHGFAVSFLATALGKVSDRQTAAKVREVLDAEGAKPSLTGRT